MAFNLKARASVLRVGTNLGPGRLIDDEPSGFELDFLRNRSVIKSTSALASYEGRPFKVDGGQVDFSRSSNATVTDADGKIKWAPHNLLTDSESFDSVSWKKAFLAIDANSAVAPNGTTTADKVYPTLNGNGRCVNRRLLIAGPTNYSFSIYAKAAGKNFIAFTDLLATKYRAWVNLSTGAKTETAGYFVTVTGVGNGWYNCVFTQTATAENPCAYVAVCDADSSDAVTVNGTDGVYLWGAHLYRSDLGGMQANTSVYPMYNPTTPKNLLGYTESLTTGWTNSNTTDAIVSEVNPVGLTGAVDVAATAGNGTLLGSLSLLASPYTFSVWLKRKTGSGTVEITVDGTTYVAAAVTGTWTRFSTTLTPTAGTKTPGIRLVTSGDAVYAWGAQLSDSASLDPYDPVYGAAVTSAAYYGPRRDFDPVTLACKGLLVEEQRANLMTYSADISQWTAQAGVTVTVNQAVAPDGAMTADLITGNGTTGVISHVVAVSGVSNNTKSIWLRAVTGTTSVILKDASQTVGSVTCNLTTTWQRFTLSETQSSLASIWVDDIAAAGIYAWGGQIEQGSFATSYIPTGAATATRNADVASVPTSAFPYSATEGTVVVNSSSPCIAAIANMITLDNGTTQERIRLLTDVASVKTIVTESNTTQANISPGSATANTPFKFAVAYKVNDFAAVVNGSAAATDAAGNVPVVNIARLGADSSGNYLNGHIRQITYLPRRISNADLVTRST